MTDFPGIPLPALMGQLVLGLVNGSFYALLSLGLAVIFGMLNVINFSHGAFSMLGALLAWLGLSWLGIGYWFALVLSPFRFEAAIIALIGLVMGIWGLYSPRRGWALVGMLLCCLGVSIGTFTGARQLYLYLNRNAPIETEAVVEP